MTKTIVRKLRCAVYTRKSSEEGLEQEFNSLHAQREACEAYIASQRSEGWVLVRDRYDDGGISGGTLERPRCSGCWPTSRTASSMWSSSTRLIACPLADGLCQARRGVRPEWRHLRLRDAVVQHDHLDGPAHAEHPAVLRPVRARGHGRAHPRQVRRQPEEGHMDGRHPAARLPGREPQAGGGRGRAAHVRWIFARFLEIGSGTVLAREVGGARHPHAARQRRSTRSTSTGC